MLKQFHKIEKDNKKIKVIKDSLKEIVQRQLKLQKRLNSKKTKLFGKFDTKDNSQKNINNLLFNVLCLKQELSELVDFLPFKTWKHYTKKDFISTEYGGRLNLWEIKLEAIDCLHFLVNIFLILGMNSKDILELYLFKNKINHKRQDNNY